MVFIERDFAGNELIESVLIRSLNFIANTVCFISIRSMSFSFWQVSIFAPLIMAKSPSSVAAILFFALFYV